jgi:hypothetical protein
MKKIILLFISIISVLRCFAQTDTLRSQISIKYSNSYSKGNYYHYVEGERIDFSLDSTESYRVTLYVQRTEPFKYKKAKKGTAFAINIGYTPNTNMSNLIPISQKVINDWIRNLRENTYEKQNFSLKKHFKTLTDEDIISIAKKTSQFKNFSSENDLKQKIEQHFYAIRDLEGLNEFIDLCKTQNVDTEIKNKFKQEVYLDYYNQESKFERYSISLSNIEDSFSPILETKFDMTLMKNEIVAKNYNLDVYWLAFNFLPIDSLIRNRFDIEKIYVNWFLKNKM